MKTIFDGGEADMINSHDSCEWEEDTYWERVAKSRWGMYVSDAERRAILMANDLAKGIATHTALDVGCDGGRWTKLVVDLGWEVISTDINPDTLSVCQKRIPSAKCILVEKDSTTLPCETESCVLLLCIEVPVSSSDWFQKEAIRVLHTGGLMVIVIQNRRSLRGHFYHLTSTLKKRIDYYKISYPQWRNELCKKGFNLISEEGICWFPFRRSSNSILVPAFIQLEEVLGLRRLPSLSPWVVLVARKQ